MWRDGKDRPRPWRIQVKQSSDGYYALIVAGNGEVVAKSRHAGSSEEEVTLRLSVAKSVQGFSSWVEKLEHGGYIAYAGTEEHYFQSHIIIDRDYAEKLAPAMEKLIKTTY